MRDDDDRVREVGEEVLEPVDRRHIEMVRRLVEQEDVGVAEERLREQHADLLLRRELGHHELVLVLRDAEAVEEARRVRLRVPAVHLRELRLELRRLHAVLLREIRLRVERILLVHDLDEARIAHHDRAQHLILVERVVILLEDREALAWRDLHHAARRLELTGEQAQERGLAGAVRADDAVAVARRELEVDILIEDALAELEAQVVRGNHSFPFIPFVWKRAGSRTPPAMPEPHLLPLVISISYHTAAETSRPHSLKMARNIERMLCPYVVPGTAQRPLRSSQRESVLVP